MFNLLWSGVCMVLLFSGCGWNETPTRSNDFVPLTSIEIIAGSSTIAAKTSTKLAVKGNFSGLFTRDIIDGVVWTSDVPGLVSFVTAVSPNRVNGLLPGTAVITATVGNVSSTFTLTVSPATVTAVTVTPLGSSVAKGLTTQFKANGTFSDATTQDLTYDAVWTSSSPGVATVSDTAYGKGFSRALTEGTSTISAVFSGVSGTALMTVTAPALQTISLLPANPSILTLSSGKFTATGTYSDGSTADITSLATWSSSNTGVATIAGDGTATVLAQGAVRISAVLSGVSGTANLKATGGDLRGITVTPIAVTLVKDTTARIKAIGNFSNGSTRDITGVIAWSVDNPSLATVATPGGTLAWLNPLAVTSSTTVSAKFGSLTPATALLAITAPQLSGIAFDTTSTSLNLTAGISAPLVVKATFTDNTTQDVTPLAVFTSGNGAIATVATNGVSAGRVTGVAAGSTTVSATYGGRTVPIPAAVAVTLRTLQSLSISGITTIAAGNQVSFAATALYSDGTTADVTQDATWSIDVSNVAILADNVNLRGQVMGVDSGSAVLTAAFGGKSQTATVTVTGS